MTFEEKATENLRNKKKIDEQSTTGFSKTKKIDPD
jgi:hypothetical protein